MSDESNPADRRGDEVADLYVQAHRRIEAIVRDATGRGADGTAAYYRRQLAAVRAILAGLDERAAANATVATIGAYNPAALAVDRVMRRGAPAFGGVHQRAVDVIADNMRVRLVDATQLVGRRTEDAFRRAGLRETAAGIIEGSTSDVVAERLRERLVRDAVIDALTGFVDAGGRRWPLDTYSRMVSRTTTREAQSAALANRLAEHDSDLVTISDHGTDSAICLPYEGETFSLTGRTAGYPVLDALPPFHPNCEHVLTPAAVTFDEWERELLAVAA